MNDHMSEPEDEIGQDLPESATMEPRDGLTCIGKPIHWPATDESGGSELGCVDI